VSDRELCADHEYVHLIFSGSFVPVEKVGKLRYTLKSQKMHVSKEMIPSSFPFEFHTSSQSFSDSEFKTDSGEISFKAPE
jgi:hypothetical protein